MPVIFITDFLIFLLLFGSIAFFLYARKQEHLTAPWKEIKKQPLAMSSAVILSFFIIFGLLDSAHFHKRIETDEKSADVLSGTHDVNEKISVEKLIYLKGIGDKELLEKWLDIYFKEIDDLMVDPTKMTQEKFKNQLMKALEMDEKALEVLCSTGPGKDFLKYTFYLVFIFFWIDKTA